MICKSRRKEIFDIFFSSVIRKNLKQRTTEIIFFSKHAQIINRVVCWWRHYGFNMVEKYNLTSDLKLYYVITCWQKTDSFLLNIVTLYIIQKVVHYWSLSFYLIITDYNNLPEIWFGNKYDIFKIFKTRNVVNISISVKTQFQQY